MTIVMAMAVVMDDEDIDATKVNVNDEIDVQDKHRISVSNYKGILRRPIDLLVGARPPTQPTPPQLVGEVPYY